MSEELNLVKDLAVILIAAGVFTIISKALKQPLILGYIVAGFIVGPHLGLFGISSAESVEQWSEIGIIFLLFALGLEFSFKKLLKVGSAALITAGCVCVGMFVMGNIVGHALGWSSMEAIFLGGLMSMSSTTIIIKAYNDLGLKNKAYSTLVFGTLVVEDLIAVVLMVLLTTIATANQFAGGEMLMGLAKLLFFLILWFLVGIYVIPTFLKWVRKYLNDEILLLVAIGLCFGMVTLASFAGFSSALGAFVMGSILSETIEGEHIGKLVVNIKDLFGAIFFVSVGMMVDPKVIAEHWLPILVLTLVTVFGMTVFGSLGALVSGRGLNTAVHTGFSLAQLGEFSFIIAGLGVSLGVMRGFIYPVVIAVSVITTFTTPYMIKAATPVCNFLYKKLPVRILAKLDPSPDTSVKASAEEQSEWKALLKNYGLRVVLYGVILIAVFLG
ncbi:MAG: cation:proton antiporter, partial [Bacteroidales bacterium]|nr:cation:proton antiporter [Bacteroidales bacterium]